MKDQQGNEFEVEIKKAEGKIIQIITYKLEPGKTTLKGEYPKLRKEGCPFAERLSCNYGTGFERCEHMTYINSEYGGNWVCKAPK